MLAGLLTEIQLSPMAGCRPIVAKMSHKRRSEDGGGGKAD